MIEMEMEMERMDSMDSMENWWIDDASFYWSRDMAPDKEDGDWHKQNLNYADYLETGSYHCAHPQGLRESGVSFPHDDTT